jgi:hypothetical protein
MGMSALKSFLHTQFHTKDLEALKYFIGVEVMQSKKGIFLFRGNMCLIYWLIQESWVPTMQYSNAS